MMCLSFSPAVAATLLQLGASNALRDAAAAAAAAAGGAAAGGGLANAWGGGSDRDAAWAAAIWAALAAIQLPQEAAAGRAPGVGPSPSADAPSWALDVVSSVLSAARGAAAAAKALEVMRAAPAEALRVLARHPGLLRGVGAFVAGCGDAAAVDWGLTSVRALAKLERAACASDDTEGGCAAACGGEPCGPGALAELRRWLSMLSRAPDRAVAWEAAAGLAAFDASRRASAGYLGSGKGGGSSGDDSTGTGASAERGAMASSGGRSSGEAAGSAGASTSQQAAGALPPQPKERPVRSCSICGQTEAQLGRAPKACAGCRKVRCAGVLGTGYTNERGRRHLAYSPLPIILGMLTCTCDRRPPSNVNLQN
jgi:hypothetical protein